MKFDFDWLSDFCGEDVLKSVDDGRRWMTEVYLSYKFTNAPLAQES